MSHFCFDLSKPEGFGIILIFYWGWINIWKLLVLSFVVCILRVHCVLGHVCSHCLWRNYAAGTKEVDRQDVLACLASQLQTSVIPQLNTCVRVYLFVCVCVCVHVWVVSRKCVIMSMNLHAFLEKPISPLGVTGWRLSAKVIRKSTICKPTAASVHNNKY